MSTVERGGRPRRSIKPRTRDTYDNSVHGRSESSVPADDRTLNTSLCGLNLFRPKMKEGPLVFRPWPALDYEDPAGKLTPGRLSTKALHQSHWIIRVPVAKYVGLPDRDCTKSTFLLYQPHDREGRQANPYRVLYASASAAHDSGTFGPGRSWKSTWNKLLKGREGMGAALSQPTAAWFVQGEVYLNGEKDYVANGPVPFGGGPSDDLAVIQLPASAGKGMMSLLDQTLDDYTGDDEEDPSVAFKYGDAVGRYDAKKGTCGPGLFFRIFHPKKYRSAKTDTSWNGRADNDFQGYEAQVLRKYKSEDDEVYDPTLSGARLQAVFDRWQFWLPDEDGKNGLLYFPPAEEQARWVARGFWREPKLLEYAWSDHPEFMTDEVRAVLSRRANVVMPGRDDDEDEDGDGEEEAAAQAHRPRRAAAPPRRGRDDDGDEEDAAPARAKGRSRFEEDDEPAPSRTKGRSRFEEEEPEDEAEEGPEDEPRGRGKAEPPFRPGRAADDEAEEEADDDEADDDEAEDASETAEARADDEPEEDEDEAKGEDEPEEEDLAERVAASKAAKKSAAGAPAPAPDPDPSADEDDEDAGLSERERKMRQSIREAGVRSAARPSRQQAPPAPPATKKAARR